MDRSPVTVVGAGPAGLAAAHALVSRKVKPLVLEAGAGVGGIARTVAYKGCLFDIGGHRFFTRIEAVNRLWQEMLGTDFTFVQRSSSIYYRNRFFTYPLRVASTLNNLGFYESLKILVSYMRAQLRPGSSDDTFEQWMTNRFGERLYRIFFKTYTEKIWGLPCSAISADWAAQRIKGLSMVSIVTNALFGTQTAKTLIDGFHYPKKGPGMMWERFAGAVVLGGGRIETEMTVTGLQHAHNRIRALQVRNHAAGASIPVNQLISSMPVTSLIGALDPQPPPDVRAAAARLAYRSLVMVGLVLNREHLFPDQWIYVHDPGVEVGRIQNFKNWSPSMVPDARCTNIGMEYFCSEGDTLWHMTDSALAEKASRELETLGLARYRDVADALVIRQPKAYPVYDSDYRRNLAVIRRYLDGFSNLQTIGRNGTHRYNNMDHAMQSGILAAENALGARHDLWAVNVDDMHVEAVPAAVKTEPPAGAVVARVFTRMDKGAFGIALGTVTGLAICMATLWLVVKGGMVVGPRLGLLSQYFWGYTVTWAGAAVGFFYGFVSGFCVGWLFAFLRNALLVFYLFKIRKAAELNSLKDLLDRM